MEINEKKILVVDDEEQILTMLRIMLQKEGFVNVKTAISGEDAIMIAKEWNPDLLLLDITMPYMDGYEVCEKIREFSMVNILFLTAKNEEQDRIKAFNFGGDDFMTKPFNAEELIIRIRSKLMREVYYENKGKVDDSKVVKFGEFCLDLNRQELYRADELVELSHKEYTLLEYLVMNKNITLSIDCIIQNVWGYDYERNNNTVTVHMNRLRNKLDDSSNKYIKTVKGIGYRFELAMKK